MMNEVNRLLGERIWNNPIHDYLLVSGVILLILLLRHRAGKKITRLIFYMFRRSGKQLPEKDFFDLVLGPLENLIVFLVVYSALSSLHFPEAMRFKFMKLGSDLLLDRLGMGVLIFLLFKTLLRITDYLAIILEIKANDTPDYSDDQLVIFFREFLKAVLVIICVLLMIRYVFNQDISKLLAGLSIVGAAIALAAKESIENLIASFIIFFDKPFTVGDLLKVHHVQGTVEKIGLRSTRIRTVDKTFVTIPNKQMVDSIVDNLALRNKRRVELLLNVDLKSGREDVEALIVELHKELDLPEIVEKTIYLSDISFDAYIVNIEYFTDMIAISAFNNTKQKVNLTIMKLMENKGMSVAGRDRVLVSRL